MDVPHGLGAQPLGLVPGLQPACPSLLQQLLVELLQFQRSELFQRDFANAGLDVVVDITPVGLVGGRPHLHLSVVKHISNHIMVMYLGQCLELSTSDELFKRPLHPYTQALLSAIPEPDISMRNKEIQVIKGEVTSPVNPKPGCRFMPRCPYACEKCASAFSELHDFGNEHFCSCIRCKDDEI